MVPGRSQKRTSTYSMFSSLASLKMSSGVFSDTECSFVWGCRRTSARHDHNARSPRHHIARQTTPALLLFMSGSTGATVFSTPQLFRRRDNHESKLLHPKKA